MDGMRKGRSFVFVDFPRVQCCFTFSKNLKQMKDEGDWDENLYIELGRDSLLHFVGQLVYVLGEYDYMNFGNGHSHSVTDILMVLS